MQHSLLLLLQVLLCTSSSFFLAHGFAPSGWPSAPQRPAQAQDSGRSSTTALMKRLSSTISALTLVVGLNGALPLPAVAISGGGLGFAGATITGQDFSGGKYKAQDFSGSVAQDTVFRDADLRGARFFKADLKGADFSGANLGTASLEGANLEGANLKGSVLQGAYLSETVLSVKSIESADFTDSLMREDVQKKLCQRIDAKGSNPTTGVETQESLMCDLL